MLVAHVSTLHPRTDPRVFEKEARAAAERFPGRVELVCADGRGDRRDGAVAITDLGSLPGGRAGRLLVGSLRVWKHVRRSRPALVHFHDPELIPVCLALRVLGQRVVYDAHEDMSLQIRSKHWIPGPLRTPVARLVGTLEGFASRRFLGVVAATPTIAARFRTANTITVRNFPEAGRFDPGSASIESRVREFVYLGGISDIRGATLMYDALGIANRTTPVTLHLAGRHTPASLAQTLAAHPAASHVRYHGYLPREAASELTMQAGCGLVVLEPRPNYLDSLPTKLFEYMSAGLPVIASDFPLWRTIVEEAGCGLLVDPLDARSVADAMLRLIADPEAAAAMGRRGREAARERYAWRTEKLTLVNAYERWLGLEGS